MLAVGTLLRGAENLFGSVWSIGELAVMASRFDEIRRDPHRLAVLDDIDRQGWYVPFDSGEFRLRQRAGGWIVGENPYRRIGHGKPDKVVAKMVSARREARHLVVVCHCYGVPVPPIMERLFGLQDARHADVVYNIMNHHQFGTFSFWPGTGFASGRLSHFLENLRSSITAVRALVAALRDEREYERVTVIGYSIGGQLALHLAHSARIEQAVLYCPVTSIHATSQNLGLMRWLVGPVAATARRLTGEFVIDDLRLADPLRHELRMPQKDMHVIVQENDALAPVSQIEAIRRKYPDVGWYSYPGTHLIPAGAAKFQRKIRELIA